MVEFKKSFENILPYDRPRYIDYLDDDLDSSTKSIKWYGVSFQLPGAGEGEKIELNKYVEVYEPLFKNVVTKLDTGSIWIVNHDDKDLKWLPNNYDNLTHLRTLFKDKKIKNNFRGALIFSKNDLLEFSKELISYPYVLFAKDGSLYKNLDISHGKLQFIIKISGQLNIDFLCTDEKLLKKVINENSSSLFVVKEYRDN
jgi:hypothetical protein